MKSLSFIIFAMIFASNLLAGTPKEVSIQTNLHCESCKGKIEKEVKTLQGIINLNADVKSKVVTVKYDPDKITDKKIMSSISSLGYKAEIANNTKDTGKDMGTQGKSVKEKESKSGGKESCCGKDKKKK